MKTTHAYISQYIDWICVGNSSAIFRFFQVLRVVFRFPSSPGGWGSSPSRLPLSLLREFCVHSIVGSVWFHPPQDCGYPFFRRRRFLEVVFFAVDRFLVAMADAWVRGLCWCCSCTQDVVGRMLYALVCWPSSVSNFLERWWYLLH